MRLHHPLTIAGILLAFTACSDTTEPGVKGPPNTLRFDQANSVVRQGDVTRFAMQAFDDNGDLLHPGALTWTVEPFTAGDVPGGEAFVGYEPGSARVTVQWRQLADTLEVEIRDRDLTPGTLTLLGRGFQIGAWNTDLWVHGSFAYTGTFTRGVHPGNKLYVWDVSSPASPTQRAAVQIDAAVVNDVKVRPDGRVAVVTHEGSTDGRNGITLLSLQDPAAPATMSRYVDGLAFGVHNAWYDGVYLYLAVNDVGGLHILDVSDPGFPRLVARFYAGRSFVHDVFVRNGLAFVAHWDAGLIILDVGNGIAGGAPANPVEVGRIEIPGVKVHNAWYWPGREYVFVGDEVRGPGSMYVVDVADPRDPKLIAEFRTPNTTGRPHNFWVDEGKEIVWLSWYRDGLYALDAQGELMGRLDRQGRTILHADYSTGGAGCFDTVANDTCAWAPQLHNGLLYVADVNSGLWVFQPDF